MVFWIFACAAKIDRVNEDQLYKVLHHARYVVFQTDNVRLAFYHVGWGGTDGGSGERLTLVYPFVSAGK